MPDNHPPLPGSGQSAAPFIATNLSAAAGSREDQFPSPFMGEGPGVRARVRRSLAEFIRRSVEVAHPEQIMLFSSAARGDMGPHSDVDLLVIKSGAHRLDLAGEIYMNLHGLGEAVDIIVVTPEDVERYRHTHAMVISPALREGRIVHAA